MFPRWFTHVAFGRRPQFLTWCWQDVLSSPCGPPHRLLCPQDMATNFSQTKWSKGERGGICSAFYDLFSEVILYHFIQPTFKGRELGFVSWRGEYQQICRYVFKTTIHLENHKTTIEIRKWTQTYYHLILRSHTSFSTWPNNVFCSNRIQVRIIRCF